MIDSSRDKIAFTREVWKRYDRVTKTIVKRKGILLMPPAIAKAANTALVLAKRHQKGDYRHTERELQEEYKLACWLVEAWADLNGNPKPVIRFQPVN